MFFESMRVFKGIGGRVIFKLRLPRLSGEGSEEFNAFYRSLAEIYSDAASGIAKTSEGDCRRTESFDAEEVNAEKGRHLRRKADGSWTHILIRRSVCLREGSDERSFVAGDKYDPQSRVFLK